jgi:hypothetical protein
MTGAFRAVLKGVSFKGRVIVPVFANKKNPDPKIEVKCHLFSFGSQSLHTLSPILIGGIGLRSIISRVDSSHWDSLRSSAS